MKKIEKVGVFSLSISSLDEGRELKPTDISASDMAEYLLEFSKALCKKGIKKNELVFSSIIDGCAQINVEPIAGMSSKHTDAVINRWHELDDDFEAIRKKLGKNNLKADFHIGGFDYKKELVPIIDESAMFDYEVYQEEVFRGELIKVGGSDDTVPFTLRTKDGIDIKLSTKDKETAKRIAMHIFQEVECVGTGLLKLDSKTMRWTPSNGFIIDSFKPINKINHSEWLDKFRSIKSSWNDLDDPMPLIRKIREGE